MGDESLLKRLIFCSILAAFLLFIPGSDRAGASVQIIDNTDYPTLYLAQVPCGRTTDLCAYPVVQNWKEFKVTWNNRPLIDNCHSFCTTVSPGFVNDWLEIDVTDLVKAWYEGCIVNDGLLLKCDEPFDSLLGFYSREFENSTYWPRLCVSYGVKCCVDRHHPRISETEEE
jgi:hypothetical protein